MSKQKIVNLPWPMIVNLFLFLAACSKSHHVAGKDHLFRPQGQKNHFGHQNYRWAGMVGLAEATNVTSQTKYEGGGPIECNTTNEISTSLS